MIDRLHPTALELLHKACFLRENHFICFGKYYNQLKQLDLIDGEYNVTFMGRKFVRHCIEKGVFDEQRTYVNSGEVEPNS